MEVTVKWIPTDQKYHPAIRYGHYLSDHQGFIQLDLNDLSRGDSQHPTGDAQGGK
jgi:hypothetical protein